MRRASLANQRDDLRHAFEAAVRLSTPASAVYIKSVAPDEAGARADLAGVRAWLHAERRRRAAEVLACAPEHFERADPLAGIATSIINHPEHGWCLKVYRPARREVVVEGSGL